MLVLPGEHPTWGFVRRSDQLKLKGVTLTLADHSLQRAVGWKYERLLECKARMASTARPLSAEQVWWREAANPCY
jgi:hypothetical protein